MKTTAVIMAAGQGTRMNSAQPKVLHPIAGQPMLWHSIHAAQAAADAAPVVIIGHGAERVEEAMKTRGLEPRFVIQSERLGTGHAVQQAEELVAGQAELVLVIPADLPLLTAETLQDLVDGQKSNPGSMSLLTVMAQDPRGFGRILRDREGGVRAIVEEAQATPEQKMIRELNVGAYCFRADWLWAALRQIKLSPKGEYYLTDLVAIAVQAGDSVQAIPLENATETIGINTRVHLADAETAMRRRINEHWMLSGVTLIDPASTYIEIGVSIDPDTIIHPNTHLTGGTQVGSHCELGPNSILHDTQVGKHCKILSSVVEEAVIEDEVDIGPFGHLRKGAHLGQGVHMGNFGEIKNSYLGPGVKIGHFSYVGDATIGENTNIGAGTVTCNYDGERKHKTEIGRNVFIGSDTMLVAPLTIEDGGRTGAGSVVTKDVKSNTLVAGVPARAVRKLDPTEKR